MTQGDLFSVPVAPPVVSSSLPCVFGETGENWTGPDHCASCAAETARGCLAFAAQVAAGVWNERGYTLREWVRAGHDVTTWREVTR